jgi:hypothetical protein
MICRLASLQRTEPRRDQVTAILKNYELGSGLPVKSLGNGAFQLPGHFFKIVSLRRKRNYAGGWPASASTLSCMNLPFLRFDANTGDKSAIE